MPVMHDYEEIYHIYYPRVCRQLTYMLGSRTKAEDIAQEAFLKLYRMPPQEVGNIGGWLSKVASNIALNYIRSEKSRRRREETVTDQAVEIESPEDIILRNEDVLVTRKILAAMDDRSRTCLIMKHSGFSYAEIAESTGLKVTSVGTIIARSHARFKREFEKIKGCDTGVF